MVDIKERPILMRGQMVRGILRDVDPKTRTMRIMKDRLPRWEYPEHPRSVAVWDRHRSGLHSALVNGSWPTWQDQYGDTQPAPCPYGRPGDRLWVRETFALEHGQPLYRADGDCCDQIPECDHDNGPIKWTPSIFMRRRYSRIILQIESIGVQRPRDLTTPERRAEGIPSGHAEGWRDLWISINGAESWAANPWCWVVNFRRVIP